MDRISEENTRTKAKLSKLEAEIATEQRHVEKALARDFREKVRGEKASSWRIWPARIVLLATWVVLPFVVLVGGGVWVYRVHAVPTFAALAASGVVTVALVTLIGGKISRGLTGKLRLRFVAIWLAVPSVLTYSMYVLLVLSSANAKTEEVRAYYRSVHPLLRVALGTAILGDDQFVLTDALRRPEDYAAMGLATLENSLHFVQSDGYVHAVDVRTIGRNEWRNRIVRWYFWSMGLNTIRHVGTADHLHVSLAPPGDLRR